MDIQSNLAVPIKTLKEAKEIVGGWTVTSKMPTISWSTPAQACKTGSKLRLIENTVCSDCYAMKGNYVRYAKNVLPALYRRLDSLSNPRWVEAMIFIMKHQRRDNSIMNLLLKIYLLIALLIILFHILPQRSNLLQFPQFKI